MGNRSAVSQSTEDGLASGALAWIRTLQASVCDEIRPWDHGTVLRSSRYPTYYDYNVVRVEEDPGVGFEELAAFVDHELSGHRHRRLDFEPACFGEPLRARFQAAGWKAIRLLWLRHDGSTPAGGEHEVELVPYDDVLDLRLSWGGEDLDSENQDLAQHRADAREVAMQQGVEVLAVRDAGVPIAFAQITRLDGAAELAQLYVRPEHRGSGVGTSLAVAAIEATRGARELWICADDQDRPKELYKRLGFVPAVTTLELTLLPASSSRR
jgi:GNAT superfamily N-acetyltransferase